MGIAKEMASKQKQIAISEFFEKNKHFLGFDSLPRAVITAVKEAVDNSLDACEEARILPNLKIQIKKSGTKDEIELVCTDNGPGVPQKSIENVFGKLLFGSRFHAIRQTRGQQGIGITGVVMYSQLTTGKTTSVKSKIKTEPTAIQVDIGIDTRKNKAIKSNQDRIIWTDENGEVIEHGLEITSRMTAKYQRGKQSVHQYLKMTSIVNPHAEITFIDPDGEKIHWPRVTDSLPKPVISIKPHPLGIHLGQLQRMLKDSEERRITSFLRLNFCGVSMRAAKDICDYSGIEENAKPKLLKPEKVRSLIEGFGKVKLLPPPINCLSPIEDLLIKKGLSKTIDSKFVSTLTRPPEVSQGNPFQIEVGLIYGGNMSGDQQIQVLRFANRVPLMYQQGGCLLTKALESVDWRQYGLEQAGGKGVPKGPATILIHLASTNVQFTSEAKEALSDNETVFIEARKALLEMGRGLRRHMQKKKKMAKVRDKFELINKILPEIAKKSAALLDKPIPDLSGPITRIMNAMICNEETVWNIENKCIQVNIELFNYTARPRSYTILATWPEKHGAVMDGNDRGGRKEIAGLWAWKLETLEPGQKTIVNYQLSNIEKGGWTDTEVFYRGAGEIIGANKLDEKILEEVRRLGEIHEENEEAGQTTLMDYGGEEE